MKLPGSVAVVIGGACGMGKCYCDFLLKEGVKVMIADIQEAAGEDTLKVLQAKYGETKATFRRCDGSSEDDIRAVLLEAKERWGRLDILVNHVGIVNETQWRKMVDVNLGSAVLCMKLAEEVIGKKNGGPGGILIHTASRAGVVPSHLLPIYSGTKAAVVQYMRAMMHPSHYRRHGIRIMCICPGITNTVFIDETQTQERCGHLFDETCRVFRRKSSTNTWVQPEWVAELLIDLLEKDEEMAGVAAVIDSRTPEIFYQDEWGQF